MPLLALKTRTPYRVDFAVSEVGQPVHIALCWRNTRGDPGPWSRIFNSVVPG